MGIPQFDKVWYVVKGKCSAGTFAKPCLHTSLIMLASIRLTMAVQIIILIIRW